MLYAKIWSTDEHGAAHLFSRPPCRNLEKNSCVDSQECFQHNSIGSSQLLVVVASVSGTATVAGEGFGIGASRR